MNAKSLIEEKNLSELGEAKEERIKLRLEATELKRRLLEIKTRQEELKKTEKKKNPRYGKKERIRIIETGAS